MTVDQGGQKTGGYKKKREQRSTSVSSQRGRRSSSRANGDAAQSDQGRASQAPSGSRERGGFGGNRGGYGGNRGAQGGGGKGRDGKKRGSTHLPAVSGRTNGQVYLFAGSSNKYRVQNRLNYAGAIEDRFAESQQAR